MPPIVKIIKAPAPSRRGPSLDVLIFRMGGVAGAIRRIVHRSQQALTMDQIHRILSARHPELRPGRSQIEDAVLHMVERRLVAIKANEKKVRTYRWSPTRQPKRAVQLQLL